MPIYDYHCEKCKCELEVYQMIDAEAPECPNCGEGMVKSPTFPAMVKIKGEGGFPSLRKQHKGSAPFTSHYGEFGD